MNRLALRLTAVRELLRFCTRIMEEEIKSKMSSAVALMGLAFLLGTLAVGCEKGDAGAQGATGAQRTRSCNAAGC
jgi:hypothetical protein